MYISDADTILALKTLASKLATDDDNIQPSVDEKRQYLKRACTLYARLFGCTPSKSALISITHNM